MAYATAKLSLINSTIEGQGPQLWSLINSDSIATMLGAGYVTNASTFGMRAGDIVLIQTGTFNTAVYPASGASTAVVGEAADFTDTPPVWMWGQVGSITAGAATLLAKQQLGGTGGYLGFFGTTPAVQPVGAAQAAITDGSTGVAAPTNGVLALTSSYNSTLLINALATIIAQTNAMRSALVTLGIMKGAA